ncbi:Fe(3+) ABC transporter substrate-binding protein [Tepidimonas taiwanensis]|uniref:Iron uptake protein A1 n=1 Tax=Tepidimonas taiwanensis TaxID=307486 RepID=A0A554X6C8_9BURK|nr:Fe(3+) ABC transporter substrate-binding protein [Tepidimonas taiwanensis]MCX7691912.1 Fe(3+) ABC transporter substrate-binding protein [Tepidimonas taiwanensis]TSE31389.1 Iron uptake protein A1 [Tepidimonas taiwanensis]UBQ06098.1 Fe(3+) ABC transporter substrate-binding protein [Tepidimonas taiwanensis]
MSLRPNRLRRQLSQAALAVLALSSTVFGINPANAQDKVLHLYSARHYPTDEVMYQNFTKLTGIQIKRVDGDDAGIVARLKAEGAASPADVVLLVDAARMAVADAQGLFRPIKSAKLDAAIPAHLRAAPTPEGVTWTGFSTRARVIVYDPLRVKAEDVATYEQLADPKLKGLLCTRSGSHPYNLSLFATVIERLGDEKGQAWLNGLVANMARPPKGGDTDQIRAVASGECGVALTNSYYIARLVKSDKPEDRKVMERVRVVFPNQATTGTHVNIAGAAVARHSKNVDAAIQFMEFLASPFAQDYFANGNNEFPTAKGVTIDNPALKAIGGDNFKADTIPLSVVAKNLTKVQQMLDRAGYK